MKREKKRKVLYTFIYQLFIMSLRTVALLHTMKLKSHARIIMIMCYACYLALISAQTLFFQHCFSGESYRAQIDIRMQRESKKYIILERAPLLFI